MTLSNFALLCGIVNFILGVSFLAVSVTLSTVAGKIGNRAVARTLDHALEDDIAWMEESSRDWHAVSWRMQFLSEVALVGAFVQVAIALILR